MLYIFALGTKLQIYVRRQHFHEQFFRYKFVPVSKIFLLIIIVTGKILIAEADKDCDYKYLLYGIEGYTYTFKFYLILKEKIQRLT